jgi:hypothetical protein
MLAPLEQLRRLLTRTRSPRPFARAATGPGGKPRRSDWGGDESVGERKNRPAGPGVRETAMFASSFSLNDDGSFRQDKRTGRRLVAQQSDGENIGSRQRALF